MTVETSVYGVRPPPVAGSKGAQRSAAPVLEPGSGYLVLPAPNTGLQFYDTVLDRHVALIQVRTCSNFTVFDVLVGRRREVYCKATTHPKVDSERDDDETHT